MKRGFSPVPNYESNIRAAYELASDSDVLTGRLWYRSAREIAEQIGNGDYEKGAGILAALSPQKPWKESVRLAKRGATNGVFTGHYGANCEKAGRIWSGDAPLDVLGGRKVRAFYRNIVGELNADVCVDRHALAIALGRDATEQELHRVCNSNKFYDELAAAYKAVAHRVGLEPSELQAITWVCWRRLKGITD